MSNKFGTGINCIDGRTQLPLAKWMKEKHSLDYIDMITEPGVDKVLSESSEKVEAIKAKVMISVNAHKSNIVVIAGHHDCAGNPVSKEEHEKQIKKSVENIRAWNLPVKVIGAWINDKWEVEIVS